MKIYLLAQDETSRFAAEELCRILRGNCRLSRPCFQRPVNRLLRIDGFFNPLPANLSQPELKRLCLGRRDGLDNPQDLFRRRCQNLSSFSCCTDHFHLGTICPRVLSQQLIPFPHFFKIVRWIRTVCQNRNYIHDRKYHSSVFSSQAVRMVRSSNF